jgi:NADH-quinone oxidoreductase subunit M
VLGAVYSLILIQRAFHGAPKEDGHTLKDLSKRELSMMVVLMAIMLWLGLYPQPILDTSAASMRGVHAIYSAARNETAPTDAALTTEALP